MASMAAPVVVVALAVVFVAAITENAANSMAYRSNICKYNQIIIVKTVLIRIAMFTHYHRS